MEKKKMTRYELAKTLEEIASQHTTQEYIPSKDDMYTFTNWSKVADALLKTHNVQRKPIKVSVTK